MEKKFNFEKIGKRMPYTIPSGTFEEIENNVRNALRRRRKKDIMVNLFRLSAALGITASIVLLIIIKPAAPVVSMTSEDVLAKIDRAYANLSESDQEYLIEIYNDDIFINQR